MSRRLSRLANRLTWKPHRTLPHPNPDRDVPARGELEIVDANTHELIERVDEKIVDKLVVRR